MSDPDRYQGQELGEIAAALLVATADSSDPLLDNTIADVLKALRRQLGMDAVFVAEFVDGRRIFRFVDRVPQAPVVAPGDSGPLEESYCQRVVDGRLPGLVRDAATLAAQGADLPALPFRVGGHLSAPVVMDDGAVYGTLCCFSSAPKPELRERDLETLRLCARLVARKLELARTLGLDELPPHWHEQPKRAYSSRIWPLA